VFADHMVLQRDAKTPVWGTADPGEEVTVSVAGQTRKVKASPDGRWMVRLSPLKAGGPYELSVKGAKNTLTFADVLAGDVWVCSGQSNMEWTVARADNGAQEIASANYPNVRLCFVPKNIQTAPQETVAARWAVCTPETVGGFSAVGYFFGRKLNTDLNVPVGLINTNWGGTPAEAWADAESLRADPEFVSFVRRTEEYPQEYPRLLDAYEKAHAAWQEKANAAKAAGAGAPGGEPRKLAEPGKNPNLPTVLYNGMIRPLQPMAIKGAIWYQGESNAGRAYQYRRLLPLMIAGWRRTWAQGDFPFLIVQLANYGQDAPDAPGSAWAELREAQALTAIQVPNTGLAVTIDIGNPADIHPTNKQEVGRRLALVAEAKTYGRKVAWQGPTYRALRVEGDRIRVKFEGAGSGLAVKGDKLLGFTVAGQDRKFVPADAVIDGDSVVVRAAGVPKPVAVRYGWANSPVCTLYNKDGLPAAPFRTDPWPGVTENNR
jgi:sialate O-acetylesterase